MRRGYDRLAPVYEPLARALSLGAIPRARRRLLAAAVDGRRRALVLGVGPGDTAVALLDAGFAGEVTCVDLSPAMLRRARARLERLRPEAARRVRWIERSFHELDPAGAWDLLCTHFVLDQVPDPTLSGLTRRLADGLVDGGAWHEVDFAPPPARGARRPVARVVLRGLYAAFAALCDLPARSLPAIDASIRAAGCRPVTVASGAGGLLRSALYERSRSAPRR